MLFQNIACEEFHKNISRETFLSKLCWQLVNICRIWRAVFFQTLLLNNLAERKFKISSGLPEGFLRCACLYYIRMLFVKLLECISWTVYILIVNLKMLCRIHFTGLSKFPYNKALDILAAGWMHWNHGFIHSPCMCIQLSGMNMLRVLVPVDLTLLDEKCFSRSNNKILVEWTMS